MKPGNPVIRWVLMRGEASDAGGRGRGVRLSPAAQPRERSTASSQRECSVSRWSSLIRGS